MATAVFETLIPDPRAISRLKTGLQNRLGQVTAFFLILGIAWRVGRWLLQYPIWGDEAHLLLNFLDRNYLTLTERLDHAQVGPLLFLWVEYTMYLLFGPSELALRFFPLLAGIGSLLLFARIAQIALPKMAGTLAVALLAVSYFPVRHATEVKGYSFDLCMSLVLLWATLEWKRNRDRLGWLIALACLTPLALLFSFPTVFVGGAISLALLPGMRNASWATRLVYGLFNLLLVGTFLGQVVYVGRQVGPIVGQDGLQFLHWYWRDWFPPDTFGQFIGWIVQAHTGNMFAYPVGGPRFGSLCTTLFCGIGIWSLWRRDRFMLGLFLGTLGLSFVAALAYRYPYGGSARIAQHLAGLICLVMAVGVVAFWEARPAWHQMGMRWTFLVLGLIGLVGVGQTWAKPYKTLADQKNRQLVESLTTRRVQPIMMFQKEEHLRAQMSWYLRSRGVPIHFVEASAWPKIESLGDFWSLRVRFEGPPEAAAAILPPGSTEAWELTEEMRFELPAESKDVPLQYVDLFHWKRTP